ncbi:unannotated protein [freshwater metagenome]|uniref:Unannotated protein n=1 Tax=freshwater metagenome TaxID=449393 RepID=A0A6J7XU34_9ZZZZ|nr:tetratricopeptide repeat protein [Actinomycetota bacterium]
MTLPPNFSRAVDLSSLGKPPVEISETLPGVEVTAENLTADFLEFSHTKPVIVMCWSPRIAESVTTLEDLGALHAQDGDMWVFGHVNIETQPQVAKALQTKSLPYAIAFIAGQMVPLFEQPHPREQIRLVIDKVLELAAQQGIGSAPVEKIEPEEEEALDALETGEYEIAQAAYKKLLSRKPGDTFALLGLAQTELLIRTKNLNPEVVRAVALAGPHDIEAQINCADIEIMSAEVDSAFERLIRCVRETTGDERKRVKDHLVSLFALVDPADPRLIQARSALANALF